MNKIISANNAKFNVCLEGDSKNFPLVLLHGNGENNTYMNKQIEFFKDYYYIIAIDTRAHGKSSFNNEELSIKLFAEDVIAILDKLNIKKANFIGFSDGANILIHMAILKPEIVNKLVLNGANLDNYGVKLGTNIVTYFGYYLAKFIAMFDKKAIKKREILSLMVKDQNFKVDDVQNINCKTLVIAGTRDLIKESHTKKIASLIKDSKIAFVKGSHFALYENPKEFNSVVYRFLK